MQNRLYCEEHPQQMLTTICICSHQCKKKLCPECQFETHRLLDGSQILPQKTYQKEVLDALLQKEKQLNQTCNEMENWNNLIKKIKQIFDSITKVITNHKELLFQNFQNQIQIIEGMKEKLQERSVFELNVEQIERLSSFIQVTTSTIINDHEQQRTQAFAQKNRELIENKIKNLENEIIITIKPLNFKTAEDDIISSLREERIRTQKTLSPIVRKYPQIIQNQQVKQQPQLQIQTNNNLNNNIRINQFQQPQGRVSITSTNSCKPGRQLSNSESPLQQNGQKKPFIKILHGNSNQPLNYSPINIKKPSNIQGNNFCLNNQQNNNNRNNFVNPFQFFNQYQNQQNILAQPQKNEELKITNPSSKIKIVEWSKELADQHIKKNKN